MSLNPYFQRACLAVLAVAVTGAEAMMPSCLTVVCHADGQDTLSLDTVMEDSLREVLVMGDSLRLAPIYDAVNQSLKRQQNPSVKSLGDILNKVAPNAMDIVMHPFGFAERKKKRKHKKMNQILWEYDHVDQQDSFNAALDSIMRLEGLK